MAKTTAYTDGTGEEMIDQREEELTRIRDVVHEETAELRALVEELRGKLDAQHGMIHSLQRGLETVTANLSYRGLLD